MCLTFSRHDTSSLFQSKSQGLNQKCIFRGETGELSHPFCPFPSIFSSLSPVSRSGPSNPAKRMGENVMIFSHQTSGGATPGYEVLYSSSRCYYTGLHDQGAPGQMTWLENSSPWLRPACCFASVFGNSVSRK